MRLIGWLVAIIGAAIIWIISTVPGDQLGYAFIGGLFVGLGVSAGLGYYDD